MRVRLFLASWLASGMLASPVSLRDLMQGPAPETIVYRTVGETRLQVHVFGARGKVRKPPRPAVVWIHGGAWTGGSPEQFFPHARYFASRGAVGVSVQYRLMTPVGGRLWDCVEDCAAAIRFLRERADELGLDPHRVIVAGDSAGGHLAAALGTVYREPRPAEGRAHAMPDALLLYNPVLDLDSDRWLKHVIGGQALARVAPSPAPKPTSFDRQAARALSPLYHVRSDLPPTLIQHGGKDQIVEPEQAERFTRAATEAGAACELVRWPEARHAFVVTGYTAPERVVVEALTCADRFLVCRGFLEGEPTLTTSVPPAWEPRVPAAR